MKNSRQLAQELAGDKVNLPLMLEQHKRIRTIELEYGFLATRYIIAEPNSKQEKVACTALHNFCVVVKEWCDLDSEFKRRLENYSEVLPRILERL